MMEHRRLGATGAMVSRVVLGTMTFGGQCDLTTSHRILDRARELGITTLDTADRYPVGGTYEPGATERILAPWLRHHRDQTVVIGKVGHPVGPAPWSAGASWQHVPTAVAASLSRLQIDHFDVLMLHTPDRVTPLDEQFDVLTSLVDRGMARYIGLSNHPAWAMSYLTGRAATGQGHTITAVEEPYNLIQREIEAEMFPACRSQGVGVLTYSPLAGGLLTGKYADRNPRATDRFGLDGTGETYRRRYWHERGLACVEQLTAVATQADVPPALLALAWVLSRDDVTAPLLGATRPEHLDLVLPALELSADRILMRQLDHQCGEPA